MSSQITTLAQLAPSFLGKFVQPSDAGYDDVRRVHNGLIDKRPALIARCQGLGDVADAVKVARSLNLEIAGRGGGHNVAGRASIDGGIMIDLSAMKGILVDPRQKVARAQGGVLWTEFNRETQVHGLATTGGVVGSTGNAGLTLGGGLGWLMPKYGLALDNLRAADMVLADGSVVRASRDENPDLFWAIRGGGGNFGIAASLEYDLHQVGPIITGGLVAHPIANGAAVLRMVREEASKAPDEMMVAAGILHAPDGSGMKMVGVLAAHCGPLADGEKAVANIKKFGPPAMDHMGPIPYCAQNGLLDGAFPKGALNYWKAQFVSDLSDECIRVLLAQYDAAPSPMCQIVLEHFHGKASRIPVGETACAMRVTGYNVVIIGEWADPRDTERCRNWVRATHDALKAFHVPLRYGNYLEDDPSGDSAAEVYGANYARLRQVKKQYDPENVFHVNVNIPPA
jgi:FAD/FMN-containing dehydrogenase